MWCRRFLFTLHSFIVLFSKIDSKCDCFVDQNVPRGFGVGVRSKRFAMLVKNGKVDYVTTDDGMDDCDSSSAEAVVQYLSPEAEIGDGDGEGGGLAIVAGGAVLVAALSSGVFGGGGGSSPPPAPVRKPAIERSVPAAKSQPVQKPSGGFSLLEEYK